MLLGWLGERHGEQKLIEAQAAIESAVACLVADPATRTRDLGGALGTKAFGAALGEQLR
jgi:3-isopropylmalate dehydrogenase